jgi:hypothetical protein
VIQFGIQRRFSLNSQLKKQLFALPINKAGMLVFVWIALVLSQKILTTNTSDLSEGVTRDKTATRLFLKLPMSKWV